MPYMALEKETCCTWNGCRLCHCSEVSSFYILICCGQKPMQGVDVVFGVVFNAELFFLNPIKLFFYTFFLCSKGVWFQLDKQSEKNKNRKKCGFTVLPAWNKDAVCAQAHVRRPQFVVAHSISVRSGHCSACVRLKQQVTSVERKCLYHKLVLCCMPNSCTAHPNHIPLSPSYALTVLKISPSVVPELNSGYCFSRNRFWI